MTSLRRFYLWLLVLAAVVWPSMASARTLPQSQTRVWGFDLAAHVLVGAESLRDPGKHRANSFAYGENASGYSLAAEGVATRGAGAAGEQGFTTLFRTVSEGEATSIQSAGRYSAAPGGVEGKYFYPTAEQAANLAKANFPSQGVQTLTSVRVPNALLNQATPLHVAGEGHVYFFNGQQVPQLAAPSVWTYFPLP